MALSTENISIRKSISTGANTTLQRGIRVVIGSDGKATAAGAGVRGDYVTLHAIPASSIGLAAPIQQGSLPIQASTTTAVGDAAYSAASGQVTNVSTNAVLIGKFLQIGAANALAVVELETVA